MYFAIWALNWKVLLFLYKVPGVGGLFSWKCSAEFWLLLLWGNIQRQYSAYLQTDNNNRMVCQLQEKFSQQELLLPLSRSCWLLKIWSRLNLGALREWSRSKGVKEAHGFIKLCYNFKIFMLEVLLAFDPHPPPPTPPQWFIYRLLEMEKNT